MRALELIGAMVIIGLLLFAVNYLITHVQLKGNSNARQHKRKIHSQGRAVPRDSDRGPDGNAE